MAENEEYETCKMLASVASLYEDDKGIIEWFTIEKVLEEEGLDCEKDPRVKNIIKNLIQMKPNVCREKIQLTFVEFKQAVRDENKLVIKTLLRSLVIRDFRDFCSHIKQLYENYQDCPIGEIKQKGLYEMTGNEWSVSVFSVDGQRTSKGVKTSFTLDEMCGPLILGLAIDLLGEDVVNSLQQEVPPNYPNSSQASNGGTSVSWFLKDIALILMCSMIKWKKIEGWTEAMKHDYVLSFFKGLCCGEDLRFSNACYSEAKNIEFKTISMAHFLKAFVKTKELVPYIDCGLDLLLQLRSMEVTTDSIGTIGSVLAGGGVSPYDGQELLSYKAVTALLNAMYSDGLGVSTPMFAVEGGVPGICTESGAMLVVIPGILGIGFYSPLVENGCSVKAYDFVTELIKLYGYHPFSKLEKQVYHPAGGKMKKKLTFEKDSLWDIFYAASLGDIEMITRCIEGGVDVSSLRDYSGLSLLHIAAAHGHLELVKYLFCKSPELLFSKESRCRKPSDLSRAAGQEEVTNHLCQLEQLTRTSMIASVID